MGRAVVTGTRDRETGAGIVEVAVTGAASGIGKATAERLGREGATVVCADLQSHGVEETAKLLRERGAESAALVCDVSDPESVKATVRETVERYGAIHVLCNIAGILKFAHMHETSLEDWNRILTVNLTGTFLMCREAIPHLLEGRIRPGGGELGEHVLVHRHIRETVLQGPPHQDPGHQPHQPPFPQHRQRVEVILVQPPLYLDQ